MYHSPESGILTTELLQSQEQRRGYDTDYGAWTRLPINYGPHWKTPKRRVEHNTVSIVTVLGT